MTTTLSSKQRNVRQRYDYVMRGSKISLIYGLGVQVLHLPLQPPKNKPSVKSVQSCMKNNMEASA